MIIRNDILFTINGDEISSMQRQAWWGCGWMNRANFTVKLKRLLWGSQNAE